MRNDLKPPKNPFFVGRSEELAWLDSNILPGTVVVVTGLSGIGKTALVREYVHRFTHRYTSVIWLPGDSIDSLVGALRSAGCDWDVRQGAADGLPNQSFSEFLSEDPTRLIVIDGADQPTQLFSWLPKSFKSPVLITTRAPRVTNHDTIELKTLTVGDGAALLLGLLGVTPNNETPANLSVAAMISDTVGGHPLAIYLTASYLKESVTHPSELQDRLLSWSPTKTDHRTRLVFDTVSECVSESLKGLETSNRSAARLAEACALYSYEPIPYELLEATCERLPGKKSAGSAWRLWAGELSRYGLMEHLDATRAFRMHRLVRQILVHNNEPHSQERQALRAVLAMHDTFPEVEHATWPTCERLLPHARAVAELVDMHSISRRESGIFLDRLASYLHEIAHLDEAERCYRSALSIWQTLGTEFDQSRANSLEGLASVLGERGNLSEALGTQSEALAIRGLALAKDEPALANSLNNLAALNQRLGNKAEAKGYYEKCLNLLRHSVGAKHPTYATTLINLAGLHRISGAFHDSEMLYVEALDILRSVLGNEHPDTATSLNNLGLLYHQSGDIERAFSYYEEALSIRERVLGSFHPSTATTLNNLAGLLESRGEDSKAEEFYRKALAVYESSYGGSHPSLAVILDNLARLLYREKRMEEAESIYLRALGILVDSDVITQPDSAARLNRFALRLRRSSRKNEAQELISRALNIYEQTLGAKHPLTVRLRRRVREPGNENH